MIENELRVSKIKEGTVIDHIAPGYALEVARILGITGHEKGIITIAINVPSRCLMAKDILKIEGRALYSNEVNKIALFAPHATINIIRDYSVAKKEKVTLPKVIKNMIKCTNKNCISNSDEPISPTFYVKGEEPLLLKCHYCGHLLEESEVLRQF